MQQSVVSSWPEFSFSFSADSDANEDRKQEKIADLKKKEKDLQDNLSQKLDELKKICLREAVSTPVHVLLSLQPIIKMPSARDKGFVCLFVPSSGADRQAAKRISTEVRRSGSHHQKTSRDHFQTGQSLPLR